MPNTEDEAPIPPSEPAPHFEPPEAVLVEQARCRHCKAHPTLCDEHAAQLVAQAFAEAAAVDADGAARATERELRKTDSLRDAAPVLVRVLLRWFGKQQALAIARQVVARLEGGSS